MLVTDVFDELAGTTGIAQSTGVSPDGRDERYLYSTDMAYRYAFARWWAVPALSSMDVWVLLNPATGDTERRRRPTLDRMVARSVADQRPGLVVINLFAFRHTDPRQLRLAEDPIGPENDRVVERLTALSGRTIAAWGAGGNLRDRSTKIAPLLKGPHCLGTTATGEPRHPLYVGTAVPMQAWASPGQQ